jgi:glycerol-3-phosphate O-acyltransferase
VSAADLLAACRMIVAPRVVRSILDAQLVVAEQLCDLGRADVSDRPAFLARCVALGRQLDLERRVVADSVSHELYDAALRLADNRSLVRSLDREGAGARRAFLEEVVDVLDLLDRGSARDEALLGTALVGGSGDR